MNGSELLRLVDTIHRDKNIDTAIVFEGIEQAIVSAARKHFGEEAELEVDIDRESGQPSVAIDGDALNADEIGDLLGRIAAQTAKQVMIQKIREAERDSLFDEYTAIQGQLVTGAVSQVGGSTVTVNLGKVEALLPRSEQIPGDNHRVGERLRAVVLEVRKAGSRVKIILSRAHPEFVRRLFEVEIPEVAERVIEVSSLAREAGYRSKVAVTCYDTKVDAVGACVGVRGARIKTIVDELAGERIDIVRWNESLQVLVPNALQPAEVEDVILCPMLGKVIVLVREDQLSLAIGKKGQNVRLASKLVGWDINVLTPERLDEHLDIAVAAFSQIPEVSDELAENLVAQGFFTFDDLSVIEPDQLAELGGLTAEQCDAIVAYADTESERIEKEERLAAQQRRLEREEQELVSTMGPKRTEPAPAAAEAPATAATDEPAESAAADSDGDAEAETAATDDEAAGDETEAEPSPSGDVATEHSTEEIPVDETPADDAPDATPADDGHAAAEDHPAATAEESAAGQAESEPAADPNEEEQRDASDVPAAVGAESAAAPPVEASP